MVGIPEKTEPSLKRSLWILSQPRVGSMLLCEILNRTRHFGDAAFQERFFHEPFFLRNFQIGINSSSIRLNNEVLWLEGVEAVRARKFRRIQHLLLHGSEDEVGVVIGSPLFAEYRAALYDAYKSKGLPEYLKIHRRHYFVFVGDEILHDPVLAHHFEAKDYIVLDRADRVAQTVSLYIAYAKSQFIVTEESRASWSDGAVPYDEDYLLKLHDMISLPARRDWAPFIQDAIATFGARVAYVDHDQLSADPLNVVEETLTQQLGYGISRKQLSVALEAVTLRPAVRPENAPFVARLREALRRRQNI